MKPYYCILFIFIALSLLIICKQTSLITQQINTERQYVNREQEDTSEQITPTVQSNNEDLSKALPNLTEMSRQEWLQTEQISTICEYYNLIDKVVTTLSEWCDQPTTFEYALQNSNSNINMYPNYNGREAAVFYLGISHLYFYTMFIKEGDDWRMECTTHTAERNLPQYRIEWGENGKHWLVIESEVNHGTGISITNEIWLDSGGNIAASFPVHGNNMFLLSQKFISSNPKGDIIFTSESEFHDEEIMIRYDIGCLFNQSGDNPKIWFYLPPEYWVYSLRTGDFLLTHCEFDFGEGFTYNPAYIDNGDAPMISAYSEFYEQIMGEDGIDNLVTEKDWLELMKLGSGSVTPYNRNNQAIGSIEAFNQYLDSISYLNIYQENLSKANTTLEIGVALGKYKDSWNIEMERVYSMLVSELAADDASVLREQQIRWMKIRDGQAETSGDKFRGGSGESNAYIFGYMEATILRTFELAYRYFTDKDISENDYYYDMTIDYFVTAMSGKTAFTEPELVVYGNGTDNKTDLWRAVYRTKMELTDSQTKTNNVTWIKMPETAPNGDGIEYTDNGAKLYIKINAIQIKPDERDMYNKIAHP